MKKPHMNKLRYTLITNIDHVIVRDVRMFASALLVLTEEDPLRSGIRHRLRGFGTTSSVPIFDILIPTAEFTLEKAASHNLMVSSGDGDLVPLIRGAIMRIPGFDDVTLVTENSQAEINVTPYPEDAEISRVWHDLERKVVEHWNAPNIMQPCWVPVASLR